jgi:hypothetical protein
MQTRSSIGKMPIDYKLFVVPKCPKACVLRPSSYAHASTSSSLRCLTLTLLPRFLLCILIVVFLLRHHLPRLEGISETQGRASTDADIGNSSASDRSKRQEQASGASGRRGRAHRGLGLELGKLLIVAVVAAHCRCFFCSLCTCLVQAREFREHAALDTNKSMCRRGSKGEASGGLRARTFVLQSGRKAPAGV